MRFEKPDHSKKLTPERARHFMKMNGYIGQRNMSESHVLELMEKMKQKDFHEAQIARLRRLDGKERLINGQHTLEAVVRTGLSQYMSLHTWVMEEGDTEVDVARVFSQYDVNKVRTRAAINWIYGCQINPDWTRDFVSAMGAALAWIASDYADGNVKISKDANGALFKEYLAECNFVHEICFQKASTSGPPHMLRAPVFTAMVNTWRTNRKDAAKFWQAVCEGEMLKKTDPAMKCREWLMSHTLSKGPQLGPKRYASRHEFYSRCVGWWNEFRGGKRTPYSASAALPKPV